LADQFGDGSLWVIQVADIAHMPRTLPHTGRSYRLLDSGKTEDALLGNPLHLVKINLLIGAGLHAETVAFTPLLTDQDNAIFFPLIDGCAGTGLLAGRMSAVIADARKVEKVAVRVLPSTDFLLPVGTPAGRLTLGPEIGRTPIALAIEDLFVVELPGLPEVFVAGKLTRLGTVILEAASHLLPVLRGSLPRLGVDRIPPHIFHPLIIAPKGLAGDGAGLTSDAFI
jgi:hypothetical protein